MIIDCISDLHGSFPELEGGDLLIIAGDLTSNNSSRAWKNFFDWFKEQNYRKKICIGGNHDRFLSQCINSHETRELWLETGLDEDLKPNNSMEYLCDNGTEFEGLKIWGSPWTPTFCDWYFMLPRGPEIKAKWDLIPEDTDILITHGPPWGIRDNINNNSFRGKDPLGCADLRNAVKRVKPKLHVFGHIHGGYGMCEEIWGPELKYSTIFVNASHMDEDYEPVNKPIRIEL